MERMDLIWKTGIAVGGSFTAYFFGGWGPLLGVLLAFVILDYTSGLVAAFHEKILSSYTGFVGIAKKVFIFALVGVGHLIDTALGSDHLVRDAVIFFYLANELLSILENAGRIGLPVPEALQKAVVALKDKESKG